jgi:hypothetical protein
MRWMRRVMPIPASVTRQVRPLPPLDRRLDATSPIISVSLMSAPTLAGAVWAIYRQQ